MATYPTKLNRTAKYAGPERRRTTGEDEPRPGSLSKSAIVYLAGSYLGGVALSAMVLANGISIGIPQLPAFAVLTALATISQLFMVEAPRRQSYHATPAFLIAGVLLLSPALLLAMIAVSMAVEWIRYRYPWYIQGFNFATYTVNSMAAFAVLQLIAGGAQTAVSLQSVAGVAAGALTFTVLNHLMVGLVLWFARGIPLTKSGVLAIANLETDLALIGVGVTMAVLWWIEPALIVLQVVPMLLFYRALSVPQLEQQAYHDAKTGLLVSRRFMQLLDQELIRATKEQRPTSVIVADLDHFRNINNTYGHLAGDDVLAAVANILRSSLRDTDAVARFGGEEFVALLKNTDSARAVIAAERLRARVAAAQVEVDSLQTPIRVTISIGVASFPNPCNDIGSLLHLADAALYASKAAGRNTVTSASPDLQVVHGWADDWESSGRGLVRTGIVRTVGHRRAGTGGVRA